MLEAVAILGLSSLLAGGHQQESSASHRPAWVTGERAWPSGWWDPVHDAHPDLRAVARAYAASWRAYGADRGSYATWPVADRVYLLRWEPHYPEAPWREDGTGIYLQRTGARPYDRASTAPAPAPEPGVAPTQTTKTTPPTQSPAPPPQQQPQPPPAAKPPAGAPGRIIRGSPPPGARLVPHPAPIPSEVVARARQYLREGLSGQATETRNWDGRGAYAVRFIGRQVGPRKVVEAWTWVA